MTPKRHWIQADFGSEGTIANSISCLIEQHVVAMGAQVGHQRSGGETRHWWVSPMDTMGQSVVTTVAVQTATVRSINTSALHPRIDLEVKALYTMPGSILMIQISHSWSYLGLDWANDNVNMCHNALELGQYSSLAYRSKHRCTYIWSGVLETGMQPSYGGDSVWLHTVCSKLLGVCWGTVKRV